MQDSLSAAVCSKSRGLMGLGNEGSKCAPAAACKSMVERAMTFANPNVDYERELTGLRKIYIERAPQARLNVIRQLLASSETQVGALRLVTLISAVEALARSLLVRAANPNSMTEFLQAYAPHERSPATQLVEAFLRLRGIHEPATHFPGDTWKLLGYGVDFRNLIVHEATFLGQDKFPSLIEAAAEVLAELVKLGGLR